MKLPAHIQKSADSRWLNILDATGADIISVPAERKEAALLALAGLNQHAALTQCLRVMRDDMATELAAEGCDHDVGICCCGLRRMVERANGLLEEAEQTTGPEPGSVPRAPGWHWFCDPEVMHRWQPVEVMGDGNPTGQLVFYHPSPARRTESLEEEPRELEPLQNVSDWPNSFAGLCLIHPRVAIL